MLNRRGCCTNEIIKLQSLVASLITPSSSSAAISSRPFLICEARFSGPPSSPVETLSSVAVSHEVFQCEGLTCSNPPDRGPHLRGGGAYGVRETNTKCIGFHGTSYTPLTPSPPSSPASYATVYNHVHIIFLYKPRVYCVFDRCCAAAAAPTITSHHDVLTRTPPPRTCHPRPRRRVKAIIIVILPSDEQRQLLDPKALTW